jgi:hypothetical protein
VKNGLINVAGNVLFFNQVAILFLGTKKKTLGCAFSRNERDLETTNIFEALVKKIILTDH